MILPDVTCLNVTSKVSNWVFVPLIQMICHHTILKPTLILLLKNIQIILEKINYDGRRKGGRKCESDKNYFGKFINVEDIKMKIEILNNEIVEDSTSPVVLKPEEEKKYKKLDEDIKKLEAEQGTFKMALGETSIDYHQVTVEREKEMEERKRDYNSFHQTIRDERLKEKKDRLKKLEDSLKKGEKEVSDIEDSGEDNIITKRICLKYKLKGESLIVKLLYEDDKRNKPDNKGFKSDWFIEKYFDDAGKDTGLYKIGRSKWFKI